MNGKSPPSIDPWASAAKEQEDREIRDLHEKTESWMINEEQPRAKINSNCQKNTTMFDMNSVGANSATNRSVFGGGMNTSNVTEFGQNNSGFGVNFGSAMNTNQSTTAQNIFGGHWTDENLLKQNHNAANTSRNSNNSFIGQNESVTNSMDGWAQKPEARIPRTFGGGYGGIGENLVRNNATIISEQTNQSKRIVEDQSSKPRVTSSFSFRAEDHLAPNRFTSDSNSLSATVDEDINAPSKAELSLLNKLVHQKLQDMGKIDVKVPAQQNDPLSPLYSLKTFEELRLKENLIKAIYEMGFHQPSKIQEAALPVLLCQPPQNMIAQSQSGTGKTAAFVLTMLSRVNTEDEYTQCLCLAPTYELAIQIGKVVEEMKKYMPEITLGYAIKGQTMPRGVQFNKHILIGTPGKTSDMVLRFKNIDASKLKVFVLDEADVMISQQGHQDQSVRIHHEIERATGGACQCLLFSATYEDQVVEFAESIVSNPIVITLRREEQTLDNIKQFYVFCDSREEKFQSICNLYAGLTIGSSIIFCHSRRSAAWLAERLLERKHSVALLTGELDTKDRADVIGQFKNGQHKVLVTTNVCSRGIDVAQVTVVINYDPPITIDKSPDYETYLHRIGRTGRFGKAGIAINFADSQQSLEVIKQIGRHFEKPIEILNTANMEELEAIERD